MVKTMKNGLKFSTYKNMLEKKAEEVRRSMSAQKAAQVVARLDCPSDEGDLSQQHHEEWIFLNRNTIDMKLLREISDALQRLADHSGTGPATGVTVASTARDAQRTTRFSTGDVARLTLFGAATVRLAWHLTYQASSTRW